MLYSDLCCVCVCYVKIYLWRRRCCQPMQVTNTRFSSHPATWWTSVWSTSCAAASCQCRAQWTRTPGWPPCCSTPRGSCRGPARCAGLSLEGKAPPWCPPGLSLWIVSSLLPILGSFPREAGGHLGLFFSLSYLCPYCFPYWNLARTSCQCLFFLLVS